MDRVMTAITVTTAICGVKSKRGFHTEVTESRKERSDLHGVHGVHRIKAKSAVHTESTEITEVGRREGLVLAFFAVERTFRVDPGKL